MNRHFEDTLYYLKRAGQTAKKGVTKEVEPIETRLRELTGYEEEPEPTRLEAIKADLKRAQDRAKGEAKETLGAARKSLEDVESRKAQ